MRRRSKAIPPLREIATAAEVSPATVSRVLNRPEMVSAEKRQRVADVLDRLGVGTPATYTVGLIIPDPLNPYFTQLIDEFEKLLAKHGIHLISASTDGRVDRELGLIAQFRALGIAGLIYTPTRDGGQSVMQILAQGDPMPVVAFDRRLAGGVPGTIDSVTSSCDNAMRTLVEYLVSLGHTRFGFITGLEGTATARARAESLASALNAHSLTLRDKFIYDGNFQFSSGRDAAERFLQVDGDSRPTAVICSNDLSAIGFIQKVQQAGLAVPRNVSVTGVDGIDIGRWYSPSITTIVQPVKRLVCAAVDMLMSRLEAMDAGTQIEARALDLPADLVVRDSTGPLVEAKNIRSIIRDLTPQT